MLFLKGHEVYDYFHNNKSFYDNQYGFRKSHSTVLFSILERMNSVSSFTLAMELIDHIMGYLDSSKLPVSVFLDLSKAFGTLNYAILLVKMKYYGFSGTSLNWFRSYLTDRNQFTEFNGVKSAVTKLTMHWSPSRIYLRSSVIHNLHKRYSHGYRQL